MSVIVLMLSSTLCLPKKKEGNSNDDLGEFFLPYIVTFKYLNRTLLLSGSKCRKFKKDLLSKNNRRWC